MATKKDLVNNLINSLDYLSKEDANDAVDCVLTSIQESLLQGDRIEIRGFGSLSIRSRKHASRKEEYNTVYYRMSKNVNKILNEPKDLK